MESCKTLDHLDVAYNWGCLIFKDEVNNENIIIKNHYESLKKEICYLEKRGQ